MPGHHLKVVESLAHPRTTKHMHAHISDVHKSCATISNLDGKVKY